jgi:outer membrane receptor for ferrienterochelin and colicins
MAGEITTSVSRSAERVEDVPATVTVITREQLTVWGYTSVAEVLERVVGFYAIDDHMIPNFSVRGISGGQRAESGLLKVMIDGRAVSFRPTGGNWLGPELVPFSAIERIEIVRGPTSTVYGADAFLGVVNIITRDPTHLDIDEVRITGTQSGGPGGGIDLTIGGVQGDLNAFFALRLNREDRSGIQLPASSPAPSLLPSVNANQSAQDLYLDSASSIARLTYTPSSDYTFSLTGSTSFLERNGEFAPWLQLATGLDEDGRARGTRISLMRGYIDLSAKMRVSEHVQLVLNTGFFGGGPTGRERIDVGSDVSYIRREMSSKASQTELSAIWSALDTLQLTIGTDFLYDHQTLPGTLQTLYADSGGLSAGDTLDASSVRQGDRAFLNAGAFLLAHWNPLERLRVSAGTRLDWNNIYDVQLNGRLGASVRVLDKLSIKLNYNSAFRAPTTQLLFGVPVYPGDILGNAHLKPQRLHTWEVGALYTPLDWLRLDSTFSYNLATDVATFVQTGLSSEARNFEALNTFTWETDARVNWDELLWAYVNLSLVLGFRDSTDVGYRADLVGDHLPIYPPIILNFGLAHKATFMPIKLGVEGRLIGERRASDDNILAAGKVYTLPSAFYLDAHVELVDLFDNDSSHIMLLVRNLLNTDKAHPGFAGIDYPSSPRTIMLQWRQQL